MKAELGISENNLWASWFAGLDFSTDWTSTNFHNWAKLLSNRSKDALSILEVGSWEGRSAVFFLNFIPKSNIICVDTFEGGEENLNNPDQAVQIASIERRFDNNTKGFTGRVRKIKSRSHHALLELSSEGAQFDLIYLDGSHMRDDLMIDSLMAWPLLKIGGILMWDDFGGGIQKPDHMRIRSALKVFLEWQKGQYRLIHRQYQVFIQKTSIASTSEVSTSVRYVRKVQERGSWMSRL